MNKHFKIIEWHRVTNQIINPVLMLSEIVSRKIRK